MRFREQVRVQWMDLDSSGRIHFTSIFRYIERAEFELFRHLGFAPQVLHGPPVHSTPRVRVECEYFAPVGLDDLLDLWVVVERVGRSSVRLRFEMEKDGQRVAQARITAAHTDLKAGRAIPLPEPVAAALRAYQSEDDYK